MFYGPERSLLVCWCMSQARLDNTCILLLLDEVDPVVVSFPKSLFREVMAPWICLAFSPKMGATVCPASSLLLGIQEEFFIFFFSLFNLLLLWGWSENIYDPHLQNQKPFLHSFQVLGCCSNS